MPPEILGEILPVPANCGQMANVQCEGKEMVTLPSRKLPLELLIAIADQVSFLVLLGVEPYWTMKF